MADTGLNGRFPNLYNRLHVDDIAHKELIEFGKYQYDQGRRDALRAMQQVLSLVERSFDDPLIAQLLK